MQYGEVSGVNKPVARIIQGTTMIGSDLNEAESFALLDQVFELGGNTLDTAHVYSGGRSERIIGNWLEARNLREKMVIITKGGAHSEDRRRITPFDITADLFDSLARLKTDHIDLYLLHRDDPYQPVEPIIHVLNEHQKAGRIHAFGASNWSHIRLDAANNFAKANGLTSFAASSPQYSLAESHTEPWPLCLSISGPDNTKARSWYESFRMPVLAWSPLASGFFTGRFKRDNLHTFDQREWDQVVLRSYAHESNFERLDRAAKLAEQKGLTVSQIALAFVMNQPLNIYAVVGPHSKKKFDENILAASVKLSSQEIDWLDLKSNTFPHI